MRTQMCRFIRAGSSASVDWLASQRQQKNSSVFLRRVVPSISTAKNLIPRTNPDKLVNYWPGLHTGFGFERWAQPPPVSFYDNVLSHSMNLGVLEWSSCGIRRLSYQATGHEDNRSPPKQNSLRAVEPKESPKTSILRRWVGYLFGSMITFWWGKQSDLLKIEGDLQKAAESVEDVAEIVENVATITEEISKDVVEKFPAGGKIKTVALFIEHLSEEAIEEAQKTRKFIDKLTKAEKTAETGIEAAIEALEGLIPDHRATGTAHNGHDKNEADDID